MFRYIRLIYGPQPANEPEEIIGSPLHVRQIFMNLMTNAIKYGHEGGFVKEGRKQA
ncbi:MAG: ATP-binding protein [Anaerovibrio sp.]|nr:hypothetical protein [Selenomonadaceae bacterium]MDD6397147.1 ATP-binding protein [Selenomonadaceae bacterium]MDY6052664.1 ATP-binding protein [Anaerovibrio sp.]